MTVHPEVSRFLSKMGKKGGSSKSKAKQKSSRANGLLGGRPKGAKNVKSKKSIK